MAPHGADGIAILGVDFYEALVADDVAATRRLPCTISRMASRGIKTMSSIKVGELDADLCGRPMTEVLARRICALYGGSDGH